MSLKIIEFFGFMPHQWQGKTDETLGEKIIICRRILGLSQEKFAQRLKIDPTTLRRWEQNKSQPAPKLRQRLKGFLAIPKSRGKGCSLNT